MTMMLRIAKWLVIPLGLLSGCTTTQYAQQADRSAYSTISSAQKVALSQADSFDATYQPFTASAVSGEGAQSIKIGQKVLPMGLNEPGILTLAECLEIASRNSRSLQTRKEQLYSSALALANERRSWNWPLLGGDLAAEASHESVAKGSKTNLGEADAGVSLTQRFIHGGMLTLAVALDFAADFTGASGTTIGSLLEANLTQPLLRGAWRGLAYEDQYRLERNFLFTVFEYERFTQTFAADIITNYYSVLGLRDRLENEKENIKRLKQTLALTRVRVKGGVVSPIQQDQAEQNLLNAEVRYQRSLRTYLNSLDRFKITLGLPLAAKVKLDYPAALEALREAGLRPLRFEIPEAISVALSARPDMLRARASLRDANRDVEIAADAFLPELNLTFDISAAGTAPRKFHSIRFDRHTRSAGVSFNYSLDQTDNRDAYRNTIIAHEKARRDLAEIEDRLRLDVMEAYRSLAQSYRSYEIQVRNVQIATRRRKLAALEQKEGEASARDVLEAEEALRSAQNGLTGEMVDYTTTRLRFLATLGMVWIDEKGMLHERTEPFKFDRIERRYPEVAGKK